MNKLSKFFHQSLTSLTVSVSLITVIHLMMTLPGQANDLQNLLSGGEFPLTLPLKNFDNSWRKISISGQFEMANFMRSWSSFFGGSGFDNIYYTQGKTVVIDKKTYLIAYQLPFSGKPMNFKNIFQSVLLGGCSEDFLPKKLTPETTLSLAFLNLDTIGSLTEVTAVNINQEIAVSVQKYDEAIKACQEGQKNPLGLGKPSSESPQDNILGLNTTQKVYFSEHGKWATSWEDLGIEFSPETKSYSYSMTTNQNSAFHFAVAKSDDLTSYVGGVFVVKDSSGKPETKSIICESEKSGKIKPPIPVLTGNEPKCAPGTQEY